MSKAGKWITALLFVILLALAGIYAALRLPYLRAENAMPRGTRPELSRQDDGSLLLRWEPSETADEYYVLVHAAAPDAQGERPCLFSAACARTQCVLPASLPEDEAVELTIGTRKRYAALGRDYVRTGDDPIRVVCYLNRPRVDGLTARVDTEKAKVYLSWTGWDGDLYRLYRQTPDGGLEELRELRHVGAELQFSETGELSVPARGETVTFVVDAMRETDGLVFYGNLAVSASLGREDFLGRTLQPVCEEEGENRFVLSWNETKGAVYEIRSVDPETGVVRVLDEIPADGERVWHTGQLAPFAEHCFEIAALGGDAYAGSELAADPVRVEVRTGAGLCFSTVWAMADTEIRSAPGSGEAVGTMSAGRAWCVLSEENGYFRVATPFVSGYVPSGACMINLPDYIGDLCAYDITNAYSSLYMVHEFEIPSVTDTVIEGYEQVRLSSGDDLVPLLWPCAKKLIDAAQAMAEDGWRIRIYDSFRPNRATRAIYDLTKEILDEPIPDETFTGKKLTDLPKRGEDDDELTYAEVMTNGLFGLGDFLASGGSLHNFGVAMDLTMERMSDGAEKPMQTSMHDLSWYSATMNNNENANLLRRYMLAAGFTGLVSEWWHFQDNEAFNSLRPAIRWAGVTPEGWVCSDAGWRWRLADGSFFRGAERTIDGELCRFDENGYLLRD